MSQNASTPTDTESTLPAKAPSTLLALWAMILGLAGLPLLLLFGLGVFFGLIAVVLGIVALVKINKDPNRYAGKGLAIVGILSGAMCPVLFGIIAYLALTYFRAGALQVVCSSNLHSLGQGLTMYVQSTRYYPPAHGDTSEGPAAVWPTSLRVYLGRTQKEFNCPASDPTTWWEKGRRPGVAKADAAETGWSYNMEEPLLQVKAGVPGFSYGYNAWGSANFSDPMPLGLGVAVGSSFYPESPAPAAKDFEILSALKETQVSMPQDTIVLADRVNGQPLGAKWLYTINPRVADQAIDYRHKNGAGVLFADGHVDWYRRDSITNMADSTVRMMWNADHEPH